jgi:hypothetical protein
MLLIIISLIIARCRPCISERLTSLWSISVSSHCFLGHFNFFARLLPDTIGFIVRWMRLVVYSVYFAATLQGALCFIFIDFFLPGLFSTACTSCCTVLYMCLTWENEKEDWKKDHARDPQGFRGIMERNCVCACACACVRVSALGAWYIN